MTRQVDDATTEGQRLLRAATRISRSYVAERQKGMQADFTQQLQRRKDLHALRQDAVTLVNGIDHAAITEEQRQADANAFAELRTKLATTDDAIREITTLLESRDGHPAYARLLRTAEGQQLVRQAAMRTHGDERIATHLVQGVETEYARSRTSPEEKARRWLERDVVQQLEDLEHAVSHGETTVAIKGPDGTVTTVDLAAAEGASS